MSPCYASHLITPFGAMTLAARDNALIGAWFAGQKYFGETVDSEMLYEDASPVLDLARRWLCAYFAGQKPSPADLPLAPQGSAFRQKVWKLLLEIPYGQCATYGEIARKITTLDKPMSAQAVGGAVAHNPISIIIPCHRIIGARGALTGYAGGIQIKAALLKLEGSRI